MGIGDDLWFPLILAPGEFPKTLVLGFLTRNELVRNVDVANAASVSQPRLEGVQVSECDFGTAHHIVLKDLYIHDVNGSNDKQTGNGSGFTATAAVAR